MVCCHTSLCLYLECPLLARQASLWRAYAGRRLARCPTKLHDFILHMLFRANNDSQAVSVTSLIILFLCMYFLSNNDSQAVSVTSLIILCMYFVFSILAHVDVILPPSVFFDVEMAPVEASVAASVAAGAAGDAPDASSAAKKKIVGPKNRPMLMLSCPLPSSSTWKWPRLHSLGCSLGCSWRRW